MSRFPFWKMSKHRLTLHPKALRFERLEERRVLASMADIVFLVDESFSGDDSSTKEWLHSIVDELDASLRTDRGIDVRYGLVGFGDAARPFAHSQLVDWNAPGGKSEFDRLFSSIDNPTPGTHLSDIQTAINN